MYILEHLHSLVWIASNGQLNFLLLHFQSIVCQTMCLLNKCMNVRVDCSNSYLKKKIKRHKIQGTSI